MGVLPIRECFPHAVVHVISQDEQGDLLLGADVAGDLGEDVNAILLLIDHALHPANLTLDAPQTRPELYLSPSLM
jgi:hypothetical protein